MLKITKEDLTIIERQLYNRGRDIDVAIYNALFDENSKEFIPDSLMLYMTKEGGIGNGLEIDNYNPNPSVYQTYEALRILDELNFDSDEKYEMFQYVMNKMCNYLYNRCPIEGGLWNPLVKSNDDYAHSEEYTYLEDFTSVWGLHPTAAIVGYILVLSLKTKAYYKKALKQLPILLNGMEERTSWNSYDFISFNSLLGSLKKINDFKDAQMKIEKKLKEEALKHLNDPTFNFPLCLSHVAVDGPLKEKVEEGLDQIIASRKAHGLWENPKGWGSNKYAEADSAALKWIGAQTVNNLFLLKHYGRIEL